MKVQRSMLVSLCALLICGAGRSEAKTYSFPHVLEVAGRISNTTFTFDTVFYVTYSGGLAGSPSGAGATVELYLYEQQSGDVLRGINNLPVCNPCLYAMGTGAASSAAPRKRGISVEDEIVNRGGGFRSPIQLGFAIVRITGDEANVNVICTVTNAQTSARDVSVFVFNPQVLEAAP